MKRLRSSLLCHLRRAPDPKPENNARRLSCAAASEQRMPYRDRRVLLARAYPEHPRGVLLARAYTERRVLHQQPYRWHRVLLTKPYWRRRELLPRLAKQSGWNFPTEKAWGSYPRSEIIWKYANPNIDYTTCMPALKYVMKYPVVVLKKLFGDYWFTEFLTSSGSKLISGMALLLVKAKINGVSFYHPITPDNFVVDQHGNLQIKEETLMKRGSSSSSDFDIALAADTLVWIFTYLCGNTLPSSVWNFTNLMRVPSVEQMHHMLIHPVGMEQHEIAPAFLQAFDTVMRLSSKGERT
ncbi:uncharacterized protein LOC104584690 [Brachypodium distachyon]|uniref:Uncharacterized protein n=1 Tax=Brachypodium distachyon TaxID=15368 RepID=I1IQY3_BRADI|nr:uncharacterized protein LOC104584690 [Brachypodium distachyon]KQJ90603.1 hypothetical protein BRADI_4g32770v3 [Brachypodium distachyon]PNT64763.1 hypothetical protein BRADI_4g32770v3 [Brachypodium distachyon]PNT64764.1 hypothetical protein BRADI_4g32770v3 [Brachypodium distachyon]PNT64765.1 hypothetical protein BRADI_4g32770v3 [Brachypodium distachyon]|eukprot:XP_010238253.1 uncharacterized protein LOC104584690 [Brachypodium distachyon]